MNDQEKLDRNINQLIGYAKGFRSALSVLDNLCEGLEEVCGIKTRRKTHKEWEVLLDRMKKTKEKYDARKKTQTDGTETVGGPGTEEQERD